MATEVRARLGLRRAPRGDLDKVFFTLGGAEANENAIRIAKAGGPAEDPREVPLLPRRDVRDDHTGDPRRWANEPGCRASCTSSTRTTGRSGDRRRADRARVPRGDDHARGPETIAAFILEPVTGTNGILIPPDGYLQGVRELCDRHGILLIADEVMSGFGRTGEWFAVNHWGVVPDIITMAKGLTSSAVPLGAVGLSPKYYFDEHVFYGGLTQLAPSRSRPRSRPSACTRRTVCSSTAGRWAR